jgi:hypothetical protein
MNYIICSAYADPSRLPIRETSAAREPAWKASPTDPDAGSTPAASTLAERPHRKVRPFCVGTPRTAGLAQLAWLKWTAVTS